MIEASPKYHVRKDNPENGQTNLDILGALVKEPNTKRDYEKSQTKHALETPDGIPAI